MGARRQAKPQRVLLVLFRLHSVHHSSLVAALSVYTDGLVWRCLRSVAPHDEACQNFFRMFLYPRQSVRRRLGDRQESSSQFVCRFWWNQAKL
jgi:hypothetical protein